VVSALLQSGHSDGPSSGKSKVCLRPEAVVAAAIYGYVSRVDNVYVLILRANKNTQ
jgi:hypothetical protein